MPIGVDTSRLAAIVSVGCIAPRIGAVPFFLALAALSVLVLPFFPSRVFDTSAPRPSEALEPGTAFGVRRDSVVSRGEDGATPAER